MPVNIGLSSTSNIPTAGENLWKRIILHYINSTMLWIPNFSFLISPIYGSIFIVPEK
jgi:hypothetical protein